MTKIPQLLILTCIILLMGCHPNITETRKEIYSSQLQKSISLNIINTPVPKNKEDFNLLLFNDVRDMKKTGISKLIDSLLSRKKFIRPLIIVGVEAFDPEQEYGVVGFTNEKKKGSLAAKYDGFIVNELLPFLEKEFGVTKFRSVSIAGSGMAGVSAIDIALSNWQKFDKVAFLPDLTNKESKVDFSSLAEKISKSRESPRLQFWLCENNSNGMEQIIDVLGSKGIEGVTRVGAASSTDSSVSSNYSPFPFLMWINQIY